MEDLEVVSSKKHHQSQQRQAAHESTDPGQGYVIRLDAGLQTFNDVESRE